MLSYLVAFAVTIAVLVYLWMRGRRTVQRGIRHDPPDHPEQDDRAKTADDGRRHVLRNRQPSTAKNWSDVERGPM